MFYLCFGKFGLFLVDYSLKGATEEGGAMYACAFDRLDRCEKDLHNSELFAVYFADDTPLMPAEGPAGGCFPRRVVFRSTDRDKVLSEFETFFRTDYMFQHWELPPFSFVVPAELPLELGSRDAQGDNAVHLDAPPGYVQDGMENFVFLRPKGFERERVSQEQTTLAQASVRFVDKSESNLRQVYNALRPHESGRGVPYADFPDMLDIIFHEQHPLNKPRYSLTVAEERDINEVAEHYMVEFGEQVLDYRIIDVPQSYSLKSNASRDTAGMECWQLHMRTAGRAHNTTRSKKLASRDIVIMVIQRKFIPPMMDKFQNIVIVLYSSHGNSKANLKRAEMVADSFAYNSKSLTKDYLVAETKANALMLDEESYAWFANNMKVSPSVRKDAESFCQSIIRILGHAGLNFPTDSLFQGLDRATVSDDPFEYSLKLENLVPGLLDRKRDAVLVREWKARAWRYLAFCVDGGLLPGVLDIETLALHVQQHDRRLQKLSQVLQNLLYFRAVDAEFQQVALPLKIADERLMQDFTFNEAVMERLLKSGYIKYILDATSDALEYPRFIVRLLHRGKDRERWGYSLQYTVCKQLARSSAAFPGPMDAANLSRNGGGRAQRNGANSQQLASLSDLALHTVVPALIDLINDEGSNEKIQVMVVSTLVNYTKNNTVVKNKVMAGGAIRRICQFLYSKHDDLVRHSCSLLNNCTKSEQYRGQVAKFKAVEALMRLMQRNEDFEPHYRSTRILIQACAVIGNLASDTRLRQKITDSLGYEDQTDEAQSTRFRQSRAIRVLVDLLKDEFFELKTQRESLRVTVIFALKNLGIRHENNKRTIGRLASEALVDVVRSANDQDTHHILIDVALRCIYVLCFDRKNCEIMHTLNLGKVLQSRQAMFPDITKQIEAKMNKNLAAGVLPI